jgi:hypothetical protein
MRKLIVAVLGFSGFASSAFAANPLTADQLLRSIQLSSQDYSRSEPDMSQSISGLRVATLGQTAQVTIDMKADGMNMSAKYLCAVQGSDMSCHLQQ